MTDQRTSIPAGVSRAEVAASNRSLVEAFDAMANRVESTIDRLQAENERLRAVLEAAEAALQEGERGHVGTPATLSHKGPCPSCESWERLRAAVAAIRQAEAER